jgi:hypothetical protein
MVAGYVGQGVRPTVPTPAYCVVGKKDRGFARITETIKIIREVNATEANGQTCGQQCLTYASRKNAPITTYIHEGGHVYPLPVSSMFVEFFKRHLRVN